PLEAALAARASGLAPSREAAFAVFKQLGFPHRRIEGWRWSDYYAATREAANAPANDAVTPPPLAADLAGLKPFEIRVVNGRIEMSADGPQKGVRCGVIDAAGAVAAPENHPIAALNMAMTQQALEIEIAQGIDLAQPILIRHINAGAGFSFAQAMARLESGARATIIETFEGEGAAFHSHLFHAALKDSARLDRAVIQETGPEAVIHSIFTAEIAARGVFNQASLSTGARLSRHETHAHFAAAGAQADIASAALLSGARHSDFTSEIVHEGENCTTRQRHKGVARDQGRNVFQGKFRVLRGAQKTDARMNADALLLSDRAESNAKPELEIYADDVECAHGSTVGALDKDAIFYMRQRGLTEAAARALLIEAFVASAFENVAHPGIAQLFHRRVAGWLEGA
ncbi:MAG: Fe-S cluster assembly protein SufD, partial [Alphaproteobacteria bacterium RIFCSPHIGHO2_12_FULL_63_12]